MRVQCSVISMVAAVGCGVALLSGCLGDGSAGRASQSESANLSAHHPKSALRIQIEEQTANGDRRVVRVWTLDCSPVTGSKPEANAACAALRDYARNDTAPTASCGCVVLPIGTRSAVVKGTLDGKPMRAELTYCMCGYSERAVHDLEVVTGLTLTQIWGSGRPNDATGDVATTSGARSCRTRSSEAA